MILSGKTISPGLARGVTHVIDARGILESALGVRPAGAAQAEVERLHAAIGRACVELDRVQRQLAGRVEASDVSIFESHAGLLRDPKFVSRVEHEIRSNGQSAEAAVSRVASELHAAFLANSVPLVQDKASDILDIGRRLVHCLSESLASDVELEQGTVIVAPSLTPSQLVRYAHHGAVAVVTETCGPKSHTAILARGLAIPLVTGIPAACELIPHRVEVILDGAQGRVIFNLSEDERTLSHEMFAQQTAEISHEEDVLPEVPVTLDGVRVGLMLNISDAAEAEAVAQLGADGVGLFRTEFAYMDLMWWPTEEEIFASYRDVAARIGQTELNIRLVDFGAEKCQIGR